jgi:hypothetical protein
MNGISPSTDDSKQLIDGLIKNPNVFWNLLKEYPELASAYKNRVSGFS